MGSRELRILSPTAILGYGFPVRSLERGLARDPHVIAVDAGSIDPGPYYLGSGKSFTDRSAVRRDLALLLEAALNRGIPLIVGTAGGCGAAPHVAWCREIIEEISRERGFVFRLGVIWADVDADVVLEALRSGDIEPTEGAPQLTEGAVVASSHIVAQMGMEPIIAALDEGCDVILTGRAYDPALFAALPVRAGFDRALALHLGKILECAAIAATPGSGADCVLGTIREESFLLETTSEERKFTRLSTAAHTLYEKSDPYRLMGPGGALNLGNTRFLEGADGTVEVQGTQFEPTQRYIVKLEGARRVGFRSICIAGIRDRIAIDQIDAILNTARQRVNDTLGAEGTEGEVYFRLYGRDGVMGPLEPLAPSPHEIGLVIEAVAKTPSDAQTVCSLMRSTLLHLDYPGRIATAGNLAFPFSPSDVAAGPVYEFSIHHLMPSEPKALFPLAISQIGQDQDSR
ncbi:MAG: acyclic terpene utilization AtuA family protein [Gemmatimonadetes bacterium]|jgi:hypothetical protein|nr:acyclic terpene utilization AtuA family protein [Gemmatimonadota bacterium]MBT7863081.1 acyclic terpene utilization AtuA family protein [Gemmatimonadota bacterium]